jgi:hypothetical protein
MQEVPVGLEADWDGTNHYEIRQPGGRDFWWIDSVPDIFVAREDWSATERGRRLGMLLEFACLARDELERLRKEKA